MDIIVDKQREIEALCQKNDIGFLGLFGSFARGDATPDSDIDLLVRFNKTITLFDLTDIENDFSRTFGRKVDLVTEASVHPYIKQYVLRDLKSLYGQPRR